MGGGICTSVMCYYFSGDFLFYLLLKETSSFKTFLVCFELSLETLTIILVNLDFL